jgi:ribosomal 50S subunit-recycling heat shock protein
MRLDVFLKFSRLCPRRAAAQEVCDAGFVFLNGRPAKPAHAVKIGDEIAIRRPSGETIARVLAVPAGQNVSRKQAKELIEVVSQRHFSPQG